MNKKYQIIYDSDIIFEFDNLENPDAISELELRLDEILDTDREDKEAVDLELINCILKSEISNRDWNCRAIISWAKRAKYMEDHNIDCASFSIFFSEIEPTIIYKKLYKNINNIIDICSNMKIGEKTKIYKGYYDITLICVKKQNN